MSFSGPEDSDGHGPKTKANGHADNSNLECKQPAKLNGHSTINGLSSNVVNGRA